MKPLISLNKQESKLRDLLLQTAEYVGKTRSSKAPELRFTGGWVRDKLLGSTSHDIDISIDNMTGFGFANLIKEYLERGEGRLKYEPNILGGLAKIEANPEKSKHLETVTTHVFGLDVDLVNLRKETYSETSRNPTMEFGTPEEDAMRRDATVNALFYNLSSTAVEDFTGRGLQDMELKVIKTPLPALQTFKDDPLRVLRAVRFASRLGYDIDANDKKAMRDETIKEALRVKISRERIGTEIIKMLKGAYLNSVMRTAIAELCPGPDPRCALGLIDDLGLYQTIFTDPTVSVPSSPDQSTWAVAFGTLHGILRSPDSTAQTAKTLQTINKLLVRDESDCFLAWTLVCFVPWAELLPQTLSKASSKKSASYAGLAAREGIKADNKICKIVDDAVTYRHEVLSLRDSMLNSEPLLSSRKRKAAAVGREVHGMAIRAWGVHWRTIVMFSLLWEVSKATSEEHRGILLAQYATWVEHLQALGLLDVDKLKQLVDGNQISQAFGGVKKGPWMKKAMDIAMEWQLRSPEATDPKLGLQEVVDRKKELGFGEH
ncbi:MAG: CCA tRNA nucleotidyltransferase, mitochondrial [Ramalina farinacea]|uniref:CCA tRNA nucleotidyltransferase, mitochondrial n=1 Tax=Ramalina farinacea TaxID=258253 RepID=A0AA43QJ60_9LECA|nr:CCA tRNA nucleotidyltransferase, mitochondrial [Ramalina farinacea]